MTATPRVLFFGSYDVATHPRVQVLREGLRERGAEVVERNAPLGVSTAERVAMLRNPLRAPLFAWKVLRSWVALVRTTRGIGRVDAVVVGYLGHLDVLLARLLFPRATIVLDHMVSLGDTASDRGARGVRVRLLTAVDRLALRAATIPVVDTVQQLDALPAGRERAVVVPVGAPDEWYVAAPPRRSGLVRVVFFGLFTPLQGATVIGQAIRLLAGDGRFAFTMAGSGQDLPAVRREVGEDPRVTWVDWVPAAELPALVAAHDVCLGIFGTGDKALRVVPNKVYQGAAAGCAVVTSDTAAQRELLGDAVVYVPPGSPEALADALRDLADDPAALDAARSSAAELAVSAFRPGAVVGPLWDRLSG